MSYLRSSDELGIDAIRTRWIVAVIATAATDAAADFFLNRCGAVYHDLEAPMN